MRSEFSDSESLNTGELIALVDSLSGNEAMAIEYLRDGYSTAETARELEYTHSGMYTLLCRLRARFHVRTFPQLVAVYVRATELYDEQYEDD